MATRAFIEQTGGLEVLRLEPVKEQTPGQGEVWINQTAVGVNPLDVSQRAGQAPLRQVPTGLGWEAAGVVAAVGAKVSGFKEGDRVAYMMGPIGAYASGRLYPGERLVKLPDDLSDEGAASLMFKGITAEYLLSSVYPVGPGTRILLYGASGAVGQIMVPWAKRLGAYVIGVVSKSSSVERARKAGCDEVLVFDAATLAENVADITRGQKVDVVYDGVGKVSFQASLDCLRPRGMMVSMGMTSGAPPALEIGTLNAKGALFLTRPSLAIYTADNAEYQARAARVLAAFADGVIRPVARHSYRLDEVAQAHKLLQSGEAEGAVILRP
ncbi:quinone oxidoreductase [Herbaspirillum sp. YR522]|uniref:quinone oxidoreductase family protein n=1 Tax=Herbaspirillum sp. YR522 TaxID=1144342 RepID=UPI00026F5CB6|nr:quinone oxidoreductase [Herbaspirillum sp. YR522]EJN01739.1 Zn-dependent oxidoreductase, NADPH:quinone reductase [Herbaspirillum sp. YR522]